MASNRISLPSWAPFAVLFLGAWLIVCSGTFGYSNTALGVNEMVCGLLLLGLGWSNRCNNTSWFIGLIGVWLQFAPLLWRVSTAVGYTNDTLIGLLAILFSVLLSSNDEGKGSAIPPSIPRGWSYNPSAYVQRFPVAVLAVVCWFLSRYLAAYQLGFIDTVWDPFFDQGTIQVITSKISRSIPIPDAGLGAFAYTLEFLLCCHGGSKRWSSAPWLVLFFGLLVVPVGFVSILLITLQPLIVHAWCTVCLITAAAMLLMITLTVDEVAASLQLLQRARKKGLNVWQILWKGLAEGSDISDPRDVSLLAPTNQLAKVLFLGCGIPWNLALSTAIGVFMMVIPSFWKFDGLMANVDHVAGALVIVVSVISFAEVARAVRFVLWFLSCALLLTAVAATSGAALILHLAISLVLVLLLLKRKR